MYFKTAGLDIISNASLSNFEFSNAQIISTSLNNGVLQNNAVVISNLNVVNLNN